jgi:hypothetical protein
MGHDFFFFRKKNFFLKKNFCTKIGKIPITIHYISHIFKPFLLMGGVGVFLSGWERERDCVFMGMGGLIHGCRNG